VEDAVTAAHRINNRIREKVQDVPLAMAHGALVPVRLHAVTAMCVGALWQVNVLQSSLPCVAAD